MMTEIRSQMTEDLMSTTGTLATYLPADPLVSSFTINVYHSKSPSNVPDQLESYVMTTYQTIKLRRLDLPSGFTPARGDRIVIPGKPTYIIENLDSNTYPQGNNYNRHLPRYFVSEYNTTTTTTLTTTSTTTTTAPPP